MSKRYISAMYHKTRSRKQNCYSVKKQSGSAIVIAIFVIIVISLLGASLISLQRDSAEGTSYEVYAARAYLSAYSASEIALAQLFPLNAASAGLATCAAVTVEPTLPDNNAGFHGCTDIKVICSSTLASAGLATRYKVVSTATCQSSQINTRRQITVEATNL